MRRFASGSPASMRLASMTSSSFVSSGIAARLAQEEVEAVGRRDLDLDDLDPLLGSGRLDDVDAQLRELVAQGLHVVGLEVELERESRELVLVHETALLSKLDQGAALPAR